VVECVRLESGYTERYRGFESLPLRQKNPPAKRRGDFSVRRGKFEGNFEECLEGHAEKSRAAEESARLLPSSAGGGAGIPPPPPTSKKPGESRVFARSIVVGEKASLNAAGS
jgi:hypothetical protein